MKTSYLFTICFVCLLCQFSWAQEANFNRVLNAFEEKNYKQIKAELHKIDSTSISTYDKATLYFYYAEYFNDLDKHDLAFKYVIAAKKGFISMDEQADASDCNMLAISILNHQNNLKGNEDLINKYIQEEIDYLEGKSDSLKLANVYFSLGNRYVMSGDRKNSFIYYNKAKDIFSKEKDSLSIADCYENIATAFLTIDPEMVDSSLYYCKLSEKVFTNLKNNYALAVNYNNQSRIYEQLDDYQKSISYLLKADSLPISENVNKTKLIFYENLSELYGLTKDFENQSKYLAKQLELRNVINDLEQNISISETEEKYQNEKLRADNLEIEANRIKNRNIAIGLGGSLALLSVIGFLFYNNNKKRQEIEIQNQVIAQEKLKSQLKEEELKSIDALIEGQEKERQIIANELHDDLGSLMATIKMHFSTIKSNSSSDIYNKTNSLIENAYQKIRGISHAKNSGVLSDKGLIKAVKDLAKNISILNQIEISVYDNGSNKRLNNSEELTIFRIIQELLANVIKHAQASEVDVHINVDEDNLNIMVEDNGIGFNTDIILKNRKGIGLLSIEKRAESLGGTMVIESRPNSGTSIIIDLPI